MEYSIGVTIYIHRGHLKNTENSEKVLTINLTLIENMDSQKKVNQTYISDTEYHLSSS